MNNFNSFLVVLVFLGVIIILVVVIETTSTTKKHYFLNLFKIIYKSNCILPFDFPKIIFNFLRRHHFKLIDFLLFTNFSARHKVEPLGNSLLKFLLKIIVEEEILKF